MCQLVVLLQVAGAALQKGTCLDQCLQHVGWVMPCCCLLLCRLPGDDQFPQLASQQLRSTPALNRTHVIRSMAQEAERQTARSFADVVGWEAGQQAHLLDGHRQYSIPLIVDVLANKVHTACNNRKTL